jgi:hypothetical protein
MATITAICPACGITFAARSVLAVYCTVTCKCRAAYYRRQGRPIPATKQVFNRPEPIRPQVVQPTIVDDENDLPPAWSVPPAGTEERFWQGTAIQRRQADGFVNATAMCKAGGKLFADYARLARTQEYMAALANVVGEKPCGAAVAGNPIDQAKASVGNPIDLIRTITTGPNALRGTWIHPRLAIDLARWISPPFAVWMDGWFLETIANPSQPLEPGIHVVAETMAHARQIWGAMLRTELLATLDTYSVGHPTVATPKVKYHLAPAT